MGSTGKAVNSGVRVARTAEEKREIVKGWSDDAIKEALTLSRNTGDVEGEFILIEEQARRRR